MLVRLGSVHARNFPGLQAVAELLGHATDVCMLFDGAR